MRVAAGIDEAWRRVLAAGTLRGSLAGYTGTAILEEADDDEHVARFRLQGMRGPSPATATITATLAAAGEGTEVALSADVFGGVERGELLAAVAEAVEAAAEAALTPAAVAAADKTAPVAAPAPHGLSAPAKRALAVAGAAALAALALRGRR
jgi:hypothetical protein